MILRWRARLRGTCTWRTSRRARPWRPFARAKKAGLPVTAEVTPHHFTLIDENIGDFNTHYKMNPPLRSVADRDALIEGILDGTIDAIATDHAPHAFHEKQVEFERAAFGITGLETALAIAVTVLHRHFKLPLVADRRATVVQSRPGFSVLRDCGSLAPGAHADVTIFDPQKKWTFDASQSKSKSQNTPYDGWSFTGQSSLRRLWMARSSTRADGLSARNSKLSVYCPYRFRA